jgi:TRAP-type mannitol/chloroaromatic compound transport system permease large subunit
MKLKKELWFGLIIMAAIVLPTLIFMPWTHMTNGHLGLLMLSLVVVAIMLGFPTAFTLMGMGMMFALFAFMSDPSITKQVAINRTLDLMVQRTYSVMTNDVLISIPLFVFMGYLVERANLIEKLFKSLHLSLARVPGALAVATLVTCAIFATATGIVGAVVTLMGLLALPAMMKAGYSMRLSAGVITAGGCLGILIPPSVMLIVYGATAGVSVVKLYAGAFFPGIMLAFLYIGYVIVVAKIKPELAPPLSAEDRVVPLPAFAEKLKAGGINHALTGLFGGSNRLGVQIPGKQRLIALLPLLFIGSLLLATWHFATLPEAAVDASLSQEMGQGQSFDSADKNSAGDLQEPPKDSGDLQEPPKESGGLQEPPQELGTSTAESAVAKLAAKPAAPAAANVIEAAERLPMPSWLIWTAGVLAAILAVTYILMSWARFEIFKMLLGSFFPLAILILFVLGSIVFGLATPTEAAAIGSIGGFLLAAAYKRLSLDVVKESVYLTAKTSAMVCWLFVGSSIFSAAFALLGGQEIIEHWVLSLGLTPTQFMLLSQFIIFVLGWPLEWTEIIVIFMPIFIPLLTKFGIDPLFFGLLVALNLQTAFLSPPVAMAAFYLKGVAPPHVTLNQIFAGMMPFMAIQVVALALLYIFPAIGLWLPNLLYK